MTPIEKNIIVTDSFGNEYQPTYFKRAKGLVKNGRARWVDEDEQNKICLACPPNQNLEDAVMENNIENAQVSEKEKPAPAVLDITYIMKRIDMIMEDNAHIYEAIEAVKSFAINDSPAGGYGDQARAEAIGNAVLSRETTNQKMIDLLSRMYDDVKPVVPQNI